MDTQDNARELLARAELIFNVDLLGGEPSEEREKQCTDFIASAFKEFFEADTGTRQPVKVEVLRNRGVWRRDAETSLPLSSIWSAEVFIWSDPILEAQFEVLPQL